MKKNFSQLTTEERKEALKIIKKVKTDNLNNRLKFSRHFLNDRVGKRGRNINFFKMIKNSLILEVVYKENKRFCISIVCNYTRIVISETGVIVTAHVDSTLKNR